MSETAKQKAAIDAAIDLFQRRYVLRILWELRANSFTFRELQEACNDISPSTLNLRLGDLRAANLVTHVSGEGYGLTDQARELLAASAPAIKWAVTWHSGNGKAKRKADAKVKVKAKAKPVRAAAKSKKPKRGR